MADFDGKVALVTGGGVGIGRATAIAFARAGAKVVIGNRNAERGEQVVDEIRSAGGEASFLTTDVSVEDDVKALVDHAVSAYGGLHAAFNNAGIEGDMAPLADCTNENFDAIMNINVKGLWWSMKYELKQMLASGGGAIVNNSSVGGVIGLATAGVYVASKHAVMGLTRNAALEYSAHGVRVNAVNPAVIRTSMADRLSDSMGAEIDALAGMHPIGRIGEPHEVAELVLWLCSDKSSFVTGAAHFVDGGYTAQ